MCSETGNGASPLLSAIRVLFGVGAQEGDVNRIRLRDRMGMVGRHIFEAEFVNTETSAGGSEALESILYRRCNACKQG